jgi:hypothetical protein
MNAYSLGLEEIANLVLAHPAVAHGLVQQIEELEHLRGARKQQGFEDGTRRVSSFRVWLSNDKTAADVTAPRLADAIQGAFTQLGVKEMPTWLADLPSTPGNEPAFAGRAKFRVVCDGCTVCGDTKSPKYVEGATVPVRCGRQMANATLLICAKCAPPRK